MNFHYHQLVGIDNLVLVGADYSKVDSIKAEAEKVLLNDAYISPIYQSSSAYLEKSTVKDIVKSAYGARNT